MAHLLASERKTARGKLFLALVYSCLVLGGLTMVLPFAAMLAGAFSDTYDQDRREPFVRPLFDRDDRFMRSVAVYYPRFPREIFPDAPADWNTWLAVARDAEGVKRFAATVRAPLADPARRAEAVAKATRFREAVLAADIDRTTCTYDPRDVASFVSARYGGSIDALNAAWPVPHRSFFDVSFLAESKTPFWHAGWKAPADDAKWETWRAFKDSYRTRMVADGDWICRTLPYGETEGAREALALQFEEHGWRDFARSAFANYRLVASYLFLRGRAFVNTLILVLLTVLAHLTVNPLAAYALSRFKMRGTEKVILFLLATMAFPAAVTAIPGFLLVRDLGLLNTFAALVLPTVASGMSIFILKGFFDALPRELYEAAAIDGAGEWTVFLKITLPMTTPILAVNALNSFLAAYNSWEWAFLVCQNESHWTLAVWMYQMSQTFASRPGCVMAGFVLVSIPTAVVFLLCQKVILRGIVLPSMK